ncbi:MAG: hypothetical protein QMC77_09035, partial [Methanocellales archaeon]|nr:hypothetical protein [Methanocellales archaeon]
KDIERLVVLIAKRTLNHQQILADLLPGVPESAKSGMERAIQVSQHGSITVLEVLKKTSPEEIKEMRKIIPMEIRERAGLSLYPVFSEYFRTCFPTFSEAHREQILEGYQISEQLTEEETNKAMGIYAKGAEIWVLEKDLAELTEKERREIFKKFEKIGQITEDFEGRLERGETRKEWEDI